MIKIIKLSLTFLFVNSVIQAQEIPTKPADGAAFPIGSKFTIKLTSVDSINYNYSIIAFEPFRKTVHTWKHDDLFEANGQDSTITFYFCLGTHGENEFELKKNRQVLLLMKNYSKIRLKYTSEMQLTENGEFKPTSNVGIFPKAKATEMWPHMILNIALKSFQKMN